VREGRKNLGTQSVGRPPDWADEAAGPAGHGPVPATSLVAFSGDFCRYPYLWKPNFPWVSEILLLLYFLG